ncbi:MAG TPA: L,D-transpeptidase family protein, partial [Dissulfurispiraceae bacterium]|nr:L,D-transpeptidase family protein [Dissulfurispiraceae bacterium]
MKIRIFVPGMVLLCLLAFSSVSAEVYSFSSDTTVVGLVKSHRVKKGESLIEVARAFGLGYNSIAEANPQLDPFVPGTGAVVKVPTSWVLPDMPSYDGIVINLSEMRLYYFSKQKKGEFVRTFPIGIGSEGTDTPLGNFKVIEKIVKPSWHVPASIRKEKPELPAVVPPGPDNPLGSHALRLSLGDVLIHGTNKPWGVGRRVSHGCIRLYPEDIPMLFQSVNNGVKVSIIRQPLKVGVRNKRVYIEVHKDEELKIDYFSEATQMLRRKDLLKLVSTEKLYHALKEKSGMP